MDIPSTSSSSSGRGRLVATIAIGGPLVLGSYVHGALNPPAHGSIWGGVPETLQPLYTVSMLCAAAGFFPFTWLFVFKTDPASARFGGGFGYGILAPLYAAVMLCSAAWLPFTSWHIDAPSMLAWLCVVGVLFGAAVGSLGLLFAAATLTPRPTKAWRIAASVGAAFFCWQTVGLDLLVWTAYFPR